MTSRQSSRVGSTKRLADAGAAGVGEDRVDPATGCLDRAPRRLVDLPFVGDVAHEGVRCHTVAPHSLEGLGVLRLVAPPDDHLRAGSADRRGHAESDPPLPPVTRTVRPSS